MRKAIKLDDIEIRCTSLQGYTFDTGTDIPTEIKNNIKQSSCIVIGVITENSIKSHWVLFELGAAWIYDKALCFKTCSFPSGDLPGPFSSKLAKNIDKEEELQRFLEDLSDRINRELNKPSKYNQKLKSFIEFIENDYSKESFGILSKPQRINIDSHYIIQSKNNASHYIRYRNDNGKLRIVLSKITDKENDSIRIQDC